jgi:hypothetical protein
MEPACLPAWGSTSHDTVAWAQQIPSEKAKRPSPSPAARKMPRQQQGRPRPGISLVGSARRGNKRTPRPPASTRLASTSSPPLPSLQPVPTPTACSSPHALSMSPHHCFAAAAAATTTPAMAAAAATGSAGISSAPAFRLLGSGSCSVPAQLRLPPAAAAAAATSRRRSLLRCAASSGGDAGGGSDSDPALEEQKRRQAELAARIASGEFTVQGPGLARGAPARPTFCSSSSHSPPPRVD